MTLLHQHPWALASIALVIYAAAVLGLAFRRAWRESNALAKRHERCREAQRRAMFETRPARELTDDEQTHLQGLSS